VHDKDGGEGEDGCENEENGGEGALYV